MGAFGRSISTSKLLTGIGTLVGIPAACYGGFCIYDSTLPTQRDVLLEQGYQENQPKTDKLNPQQVTKENQWKIDRLDCFNRFFPDAEATLTDTEETESNNFTSFFNITNKGENTDVVGCTLAKLTFTDKDNFTYGSEIVFKNSNFGWAVWTHNHRQGVPQKTEKVPKILSPNECIDEYDRKLWSFHVLFLEKEKESEQWKVKGGFYLSEYDYFTSGSPEIISPSGKRWMEDTQQKISSYSGLFTTTLKKRKSVLEGGNIFMYGNKKSFFGNPSASAYGINFIGFYKTSNKKWQTIKAGQSATDIWKNLNSFYAPFKEKKGQWFESHTYCHSLSERKRLSPSDFERLKTFCYSPKSSTSKA